MRKIMFNDYYGLTEAVLQGRKTMTRRLVPIKEAKRLESFFDSDDWNYAKQTCIDDSATYEIGEVVAVEQSYKDIGYTKEWVEQHVSPNPNANWNDPFEKKYPSWSNKMFVSAKFMPHQIRITDIKVERLQDISDEDCLKEGVYFDERYWVQGYNVENLWNKIDRQSHFRSAKAAFAALIERPGIGHKGDWNKNPWVFVYTFKLIKYTN